MICTWCGNPFTCRTIGCYDRLVRILTGDWYHLRCAYRFTGHLRGRRETEEATPTWATWTAARRPPPA